MVIELEKLDLQEVPHDNMASEEDLKDFEKKFVPAEVEELLDGLQEE